MMPAGGCTLYHGTSLAKALRIQEQGFDAGLSGSTHKLQQKSSRRASNESLLGHGIYAAPELATANDYATGGDVNGDRYQNIPSNPYGGCVLELSVDLGKMHAVTSHDDPLRTNWGAEGFDSAHLPADVEVATHEADGELCSNPAEYCIREAARIEVVGFHVSVAATAAGWSVRERKLCFVEQHCSEQEGVPLATPRTTAVEAAEPGDEGEQRRLTAERAAKGQRPAPDSADRERAPMTNATIREAVAAFQAESADFNSPEPEINLAQLSRPTRMMLCKPDGSNKHVRWFRTCRADTVPLTVHWTKKRDGSGGACSSGPAVGKRKRSAREFLDNDISTVPTVHSAG
jgi:hypothetical protein